MPSEDTGILELIQYNKSDKEPFFVYTDLECIIKQTDGCKNNPENSFTTKLYNQVFQCLQYLHLEAQKIRIKYREVKIV